MIQRSLNLTAPVKSFCCSTEAKTNLLFEVQINLGICRWWMHRQSTYIWPSGFKLFLRLLRSVSILSSSCCQGWHTSCSLSITNRFVCCPAFYLNLISLKGLLCMPRNPFFFLFSTTSVTLKVFCLSHFMPHICKCSYATLKIVHNTCHIYWRSAFEMFSHHPLHREWCCFLFVLYFSIRFWSQKICNISLTQRICTVCDDVGQYSE